MSIDCPRCGLVNPDDASVCDCGRRLGPSVVESRDTSDTRHFEVSEWLLKIGLEQYGDLFHRNDLDSKEVLDSLTDSDLETIGVESLGHRRKLLAEIKKLSSRKTTEQPVLQSRPARPPSPPRESGSNPWRVVGWLLATVLVIIIVVIINGKMTTTPSTRSTTPSSRKLSSCSVKIRNADDREAAEFIATTIRARGFNIRFSGTRFVGDDPDAVRKACETYNETMNL